MSFAPQAHAGAWPMPKGQGQAIIGLSGQTACESFDSNGKATQSTDYEKLITDVYLEHGLSETFTLVLNAGYESVSLKSPGRDVDNISGVSAAQIAVRRTFARTDRSVASVQAGIILGNDGENVPGAKLGEGGTDIEIGALLGRSGTLMGKDTFVQGHAAYRFRESGFEDEIRLDLTAGIQTHPRYQLFLQGFYAEGDGGTKGFSAYKRLKIQPSISFEYKRDRRVQLGLSQTVWGESSLNDTGAFIAVWRRY